MIGALRGIIESKESPTVVMVGGVGYLVHITPTHLATIAVGSEISLRIYTVVRDDAIELYGFPGREDIALFTMLLGVSGIGPKTALAILDRKVSDIFAAVKRGDSDFFTGIPRLGKKNAQKIIIELKPKLGDMTELDLSGNNDPIREEVTNALLTMGFKKTEILGTLAKAPSGLSLEDSVRYALKHMGKHNETK